MISRVRGDEHNAWVELLFSATLALPSSVRSTNFYQDQSDLHAEFLTTAAQRRSNLLAHLRQVKLGDLILVGEAAGWRGARQSGIAFTAAPTVGLPGTREASATIVQESLHKAGLADRTLLWNAFPTHPHRVGAPHTNRTPTTAELAEAAEVLRTAIGTRLIVCVGRSASHAVSAVLGDKVHSVSAAPASVRAVAVRHPSFGGASLFRAEFSACLVQWGMG